MPLGSVAPDFSLKDQHENTIQLSNLKGRKVLLSFHPLAWTSVCSEQMKSLEAAYDQFEAMNVLPLGVSVDPVPSKKAWAEALGLKKLHILSDFWPHGEVARAFGIFREQDGFSERANVLIDEQGKIVWIKVYPIGQLPDINEILDFLKA
ncbi:thioredoxin peroxidase [Thermotoga sp. Ku-13t]|nr:thioredoxin peroxidase [Thermotoga sp. Ku-13t]